MFCFTLTEKILADVGAKIMKIMLDQEITLRYIKKGSARRTYDMYGDKRKAMDICCLK